MLFWKRALSILLAVLIVTSGFIQPAFAQDTTNVPVNADETAQQITGEQPAELQAAEETQTPNVSGTLTQNGSGLPNVLFSVHNVTKDKWFDTKTDKDGKFTYLLSDGEYELQGVWVDAEQKWYPLNQPFTVANNKLEGAESLLIKLPDTQVLSEHKNVTGVVTKDGQPLANTPFSIHTTDGTNQWHDASTNAQGEFSFTNLPDGEYQVDGIWVGAENKWYALDQKVFTVAKTASVNIELITEKPPVTELFTVNGTLTKNGTAIKNASFSIHSTGAEQKWYDVTSDEKGSYTFDVPAGDYQLDGVWLNSEGKWYQLNQPLTVKENMEWNVSIVVNEISGVMTKEDEPVKDVSFSIHTIGENPVWVDAKTDNNGQFILSSLPDGDYQIDGVWVDADTKWYSLGKTFNVKDGMLSGASSLTIELLSYNVKGTVTKGKEAIQDLWINVHSTSGQEVWYNTQTKADGSFRFNLPDGDYQLEGVWVASEAKWYSLPLQFSVKDNSLVGTSSLKIDLKEKEPNISGVVTNGSTPVGGVWVSTHTTEGTEQWFDAQANEKGSFQLDLPDGTYQIEGIWVAAEEKWYPLTKKFSVQAGVLVGSEQLKIDIKAPEVVNNVNGVVSKGSNSLAGVTINAHTVNGEEKWYSSKTNENGQFGLNLPDGDYQVEGIWLSGEQKWYPLPLAFSVVDGQLQGQSQLLIDLAPEQPIGNVHAKVVDVNGPIANAGVTIINTDTDVFFRFDTNEQGEFITQLPDGNYFVDGIWIDGEYVYLDKVFQVENGKLMVDGAESENLTINLPPVTFQVQLNSNGAYVYGINVSQTIGAYYREMYVTPDAQGNYSLRVSDGSYTVEGYYDNNGYYVIGETIQVKNGTINPSPYIITVNENVPPAGNVQGVVQDGSTRLKYGSIRIENGNWYSNYVQIDENGKFAVDLADGDYVITNVSSGNLDSYPNMAFTVTNGNIFVNGSQQSTLTVEVKVTVKGTVVDHDKAVPYAQVGYLIYSGYYSNWGSTTTDENGEFSLRLGDGEYEIRSITLPDNQSRITESIPFEVKNGQLLVDGASQEGLTLVIPQNDIAGKLVDENGTPIPNKDIDLNQLVDGHYAAQFTAHSDENGEFHLRYPDGDYNAYETWVGEENRQTLLDIPFSINAGKLLVNGVEQDQLVLKIPPINIAGQLVDGENVLADTWLGLSMEKENGGFGTSLKTDENGHFAGRLPDGSYQINNVNTNSMYRQLKIKFDVVDGQPSIDFSRFDINMVTGNVTGAISSEAGAVANAEVEIMNQNTYNYTSVTTNSNGEFGLDLTDGDYKVVQVWANGESVRLDSSFTVENGQVFVDGVQVEKLNLNLPAVSLIGQLVNEGVPMANTELAIRALKGNQNGYYTYTDHQGYFNTRLPDGDFKIEGYFSQDGLKKLNRLVSVVDGKSIPSPYIIDISEAAPGNVVGTVMNGSDKVSFADLTIYNMGVPGEESYSVTTNVNGEFGLDLPDGQYRVSWIHSDVYIGQMNLSFTVEGGQLFVDGKGTDQLMVSIQQITVTGQVLDGETPVAWRTIYVESTQGNGWYNTQTDQNGNFSLRLADGDYVATEMPEYGPVPSSNSVLFNTRFSVVNGQLVKDGATGGQLILTLPKNKFTGTVTDQGQPIAGRLDYSLLNSNRQYSVYADENGSFSLQIPDGEYKINGFWNQNDRYEVEQLVFMIQDGQLFRDGVLATSIDVKTLAESFTGTLMDGNQVLTNTQINVTNNQTGQWYYDQTDENGQFSFRLPDGDYHVDQVWYKDNESIQMDVPFSIQNGKTIMNGVEQSNVILSIPAETLKGVVLDNGVPVLNAQLNILRKNTSEDDVRYYYAGSDENGQLSARLPDGDYVIKHIWNETMDFPLDTAFSIVDGLMVVNGSIQSQLEIHLPNPLQGQYLLGGNPVKNGNIVFNRLVDGNEDDGFSVDTDENGQFTLRLPDGHYQAIASMINDHEGAYLNDSFEVVNGVLVVNGTEVSSLTLHAPEAVISAKLVDGISPVANADIYIMRGNPCQECGGFSPRMMTDENGEASIRLADGAYTVGGVYMDGYTQLNIQFTVENGKLFVNGEQRDQLLLSLPPVSLKGTVVNGSTPIIYGSIQVKNTATDDEYWFNADRNGNLAGRLADGEYEIFSVYVEGDLYEMNQTFSIENGKINPAPFTIDVSGL